MLKGNTPNHATIELEGDNISGESEIFVNSDEINWLHAQSEKPGAEFDLVLLNHLGVEQFRKKMTGESDRYGAKINLPISDNRYIIKAENIKGTKRIDIFVE